MRYSWLKACGISALLMMAAFGQAAHAATGRTSGTFNVSSTGAATYQIPIQVPPGPKGIQPNLALSYDSDTDNTTLGVGWTLSGLSAITRCNATYAQHGVGRGVMLNDWDAFCLDGKALRLGTGLYGTAGSTYFTELANFAKVTANGTAGYGPQYFVVQGKDGLTYEYGNSPDSQVLLRSNIATPYQWLLNKVSDRSGNSYKVTYYAGETDSAGIAIPRTIQYTPASSGSATYNYTIDFTYTTRVTVNSATLTASIVGWIANVSYVNPNLLSGISVSSGGSLLRKYSLAYETAATPTAGARLKTITECAGSAGTDCYSPTTMVYQDGSVATNSSAVTVVNGNYFVLGAFDFNGDGRTDILYRDSNNALYVTYSTGSGYTTPVALGVTYTLNWTTCVYQLYCPEPSAIDFVDAAGTGGVDVMIPVSNVWWRYRWNGSALVGVSTGISSVNQGIWRDFNGDGLPDLISLSASGSGASVSVSLAVKLNTSTGGIFSLSSVATVAWTTSINCAGYAGAGYCYLWLASSLDGFDPSLTTQSGAARRVGFDANGDGRADVVIRRYIGNPWVYPYPLISNSTVLTSQGNAYVEGSTLATNYYSTITRYAKINDDACSDYLYVGYWSTGYTNSTSVQISDCNGNAGSTIPLSYTVLGVVDWDLDGRQDLIVDSGGYLAVMYSQGTSFSAPVSTAILATGTLPGALLLDANGDEQWDLGRITSSGMTYNLHENPAGSNAPNKLASITDGFGVATSIAYTVGHFSNGTSAATSPESPVSEPLTVVGQVTQSDGVGGTFSQAYNYSGAREDTQGRGFSGFQTITMSDNRAATPVVKTYYKTAFPYTGMVYQQDVFQNNGTTLISRTVNTPSVINLDTTTNNQRYFPYISATTTDTREVGGTKNDQLVTTAAASFTYDNYGNVTSSTSTVTDKDSASPQSPTYNQVWTKVVTNTLSPNTANWCLGIPTQTTVQQYATSVSSITRTTSYTPDYVNCRITQSIVEPSSSSYKVTTGFGYDAFGNVNSQTVTGINMTARTTTTNWGATGQFPINSTNAEGHYTQAGYNFNLGVLSSATDPNGLITSWTHDNFGRRLTETRPDGTSTAYSYKACASVPGGCQNGDPAGSTSVNKMVVTSTFKDASGTPLPDEFTYLDQFNRTIVTKTNSLSGYTRVGTQYNAFGQLYRQTDPCDAASCSVYWTTNTYDALGRLTAQSRPISASNGILQTTNVSYQGMSTLTTDPQSKATTKTTDPNGWLRRSTDHNGYYQNFTYDAFGSLKTVVDSSSNALFSANYAYGIEAFQTATTDLNLGTWGYTPNALGEVVAYTDAKSAAFTLTYDKLSRPKTRYVAGAGTTTWTYGTTASQYEIGQLESVTSTGGTTENYTYDNKGRLSQRQIVADATYNYDYSYSATTGQLDTLTYPTSTSSYRLKLQYLYQNGLPQQIKDYNAATVFWQANTVNPRGQVTQETLGNGLVTNRSYDAVTGWVNSIQSGIGGGTGLQNNAYLFDKLGNLIQRQDNQQGLTENFVYDDLYRLDYSQRNGVTNLDLSYDALGNITTKSDVGTYTYDTVKKHRLTGVTGGYTFGYDNNGNATTGFGAAVNWTPYNYLAAITFASDTYIQFSYDANNSRWKQENSYLGDVDTTYYIGGLMEKWEVSGYTAYRHYIDVGGSRIVYVRWSDGYNETYYTSKDHLGSMARVTDAWGDPVLAGSFNAFGERRATDWSNDYPSDTDYSTMYMTDPRGFTGHEQLDNVNLIHMNGRVYSPWLGKFLSADPYITEPGNTQNYNRYSYVYNNPLSYTDPSGFNVNTCTMAGADYESCMDSYWKQQFGQMNGYDAQRYSNPQATFYTSAGTYSGGLGWSPGSAGSVLGLSISSNGRYAYNYITLNPGTDFAVEIPLNQYSKVCPNMCASDIGLHEIGTTIYNGGSFTGNVDINGNWVGPNQPGMTNLLDQALQYFSPVGPELAAIKIFGVLGKASKVFSKEKQALIDMAKADSRKGITSADMQAYKDLNRGLPDPFPGKQVRGPEAHSSGLPSSQAPHGHVGPVNHIPIVDP